jgi:hypothetical protein
MPRYENLTGKKFGRLTAISSTRSGKSGGRVWECICTCGNRSEVLAGNLKSGSIKSCGCMRRERFLTHGHSHTRLHHVWVQMKQRCYNQKDKSYKWYGEQGVSLCDDWSHYESFYRWAMESGYEDGLTIDRIDSKGEYSPDNCRWIPLPDNARRAAEKIITIDGCSKNYSQWDRDLRLPACTVGQWVSKHSVEYASLRISALLHPEQYTKADIQDPDRHREKYLTACGRTLPYSHWAKEINVSKSTIGRWAKRGAPFAEEQIKQRLSS